MTGPPVSVANVSVPFRFACRGVPFASGALQKLTGGAADGAPLLKKSTITLETARTIQRRDPDSAIVLAYDAARQSPTALLAQQGLRPTTKGGHYAVEQAVRAQFGPGFRRFGALRRRRNELEYPSLTGDDASVGEAADSTGHAQVIVAAASELIDRLEMF